MTENDKPKTDSWDDYLDTFFKAEHVKNLKNQTFVISLKSDINDRDENILIYTVQHEGKKFLWQPNKTNMTEFVKLGVKSPKDLVNKNLYFEKIKVQNPQTHERVDSLVITKVE